MIAVIFLQHIKFLDYERQSSIICTIIFRSQFSGCGTMTGACHIVTEARHLMTLDQHPDCETGIDSSQAHLWDREPVMQMVVVILSDSLEAQLNQFDS